jgi:hypothetical protein
MKHILQIESLMRHRLYKEEPKIVRDNLHSVCDLADQIHDLENELVKRLYYIDQKRYYVRLQFHSLRGFCVEGLKFSMTQAQRIVTRVRRHEPTIRLSQP